MSTSIIPITRSNSKSNALHFFVKQDQHFLNDILNNSEVPQSSMRDILTLLEDIFQFMESTTKYNRETGTHMGRVGRIGAYISKNIGLGWKERLECTLGGWIHDIGKMYIPSKIINKPSKLNSKEYEIVKMHVHFGCEIVKGNPGIHYIMSPLAFHHEFWNGGGYPIGLSRKQIPISARIICLADAYDAMTSQRPYPPYRRTPKEAFDEIKRCANKQFDPELAKLFCALMLDALNGKNRLVE